MRSRCAILAVGIMLASASLTRAANLYLDSDAGATTGFGIVGGGEFSWSTAGDYWRNGSSTGALGSWSDDGTAVLGGTPGTLTLDGNITAGSLKIGSTGYVIDTGTSGVLTVTGGTIDVTRTSGTSAKVATINAAIAGSKGLTKVTAGAGGTTVTELILGGANTYSGATSVVEGQLTLNSAGALGNSTSVSVTGGLYGGTDGTTLMIGSGANNATFNQGLTLTSNSSTSGRARLLNYATNATWAGDIAVAGDTNIVAITNTYTLTISGDISGDTFTGSAAALLLRGNGETGYVTGGIDIGGTQLTKTDGGTWVIGNAAETQTYAWGATAIKNGTLKMAAANVLPSATVLAFGETGASTLDLNGCNQTIAGLTRNESHSATVTNSSDTAATLTVNVASGSSYTFSGSITGSALAITKSGDGELILSGKKTYTGDTIVNAGSLTLSDSTAFDVNSATDFTQISGNGSLAANGTFAFDLSDLTEDELGATWNVVAVANRAFGDDFGVTYTYGSYGTVTAAETAPDSGRWLYTMDAIGVTAMFTESTGELMVSAIPEPGSLAILFAGLIGLIVYAWRRRK